MTCAIPPLRRRTAPAIRAHTALARITVGLILGCLGSGWVVVPPAAAADQTPGRHIEVLPDRLPAPAPMQSVANGPEVVARPRDATLAVPAGFAATLFAELEDPREFLVLPNGDVLVAQPGSGLITLLRDGDGDGRAEIADAFADGLAQPYGLARHGDAVYVADLRGVWHLPWQAGARHAGGPPQRVTPDGAFGIPGGHSSRTLVFAPSGEGFYVGIGSRGNVGEEPAPRATIQAFAADGSGQRDFATGLRNPVGLAIRPGTGELWTVVNERDGLGNGLVPDYLTRVQDGGFYGWPYSYIGSHPQPGLAGRRPDLVARAIVPDVLFEAHSAPIGLAFYTGTMFPAEYRGDAFVALRGSWNRADPTGYMVVRVPFADGRPRGGYDIFASGFWIAGTGRAQVWGRPTGLAVAADGALLIADDAGGTVWRVTYSGQ